VVGPRLGAGQDGWCSHRPTFYRTGVAVSGRGRAGPACLPARLDPRVKT
jgi:hypothetical protein